MSDDETKFKKSILHGECRAEYVAGRVTMFEMLLLNDIMNMSNGDRGCYATATWFAERWRKRSDTTRHAIAKLKSLGLIIRKQKNGRSFLIPKLNLRVGKIPPTCGKNPTARVGKNPHPSHTTYGNRKKMIKASPTKAGASTLLDFPDDNKTNAIKNETPSSILADAFLEFAIKERLFTISKRRKPAMMKWKAAAEELIESNSIKRIRQVMNWYFDEWKDEWLPTCKAFPTFADKFNQIEKAMVRKHPDRKRSASKRTGKLKTVNLASGKRIQIRET